MYSRNILIVAVAGLVLILGLGALSIYLFISSNTGTLSTNTSREDLFPFSNGGPISPTATTNVHGGISSSSLEVATVAGSLFVLDFTKGTDIATSTDYFYTGYPRGSDTTTQDAEYQIFFFPNDKSFLVSILKEPIGEIRRKASDDLMSRLGISNKELCTLIAEVIIPKGVNDYYGGVSLGFPGCPGAVKFEGDTNL
ncbi:MAG: hypothetical protein V4449_03110 [Patescibacteria group bacterium]